MYVEDVMMYCYTFPQARRVLCLVVASSVLAGQVEVI